MPDASVAHRAVLAAGVDDELAAVAGDDARRHPEGGVMLEVVESAKRRALVLFYRRLRVSAEELVAALPKLSPCVRALRPVQVADAAAPVDEVEVALRLSARQRGAPRA